MRILYHHRTQADDAQGVHIYEMIKAFRDLGHEVEVAALVERDRAGRNKVRGRGWERFTRRAPAVVSELMSWAYNLVGYRRLAQRIRAWQPDLIYERYSLNTVCGIWASRRFGVPLVLEVNAPLAYEQERLGALTFPSIARATERWICSHSTHTVVVSAVMQHMLRRTGVPAKRLSVMPNGINPGEFDPKVSGGAVIRRYGLEEACVMGFVGWFRRWHGLERLVDAFADARLGEAGARLLLIGDGPAAPDLRRRVAARRCTDYVIFTGPVDRAAIPEHIAALDVALQPSATEYASPMKVFEYMAMGKCIVAPDQPNLREILDDGETAYLFVPHDAQSLRAALLRAMSSRDRRRAVGERARRTVFERGFLWTANAQRVVELVFGGSVVDPSRSVGEAVPISGEAIG